MTSPITYARLEELETHCEYLERAEHLLETGSRGPTTWDHQRVEQAADAIVDAARSLIDLIRKMAEVLEQLVDPASHDRPAAEREARTIIDAFGRIQ